ncbi:hypothetical protein EBZ80_13730 [bacterium]|nr:hypothetical protein [bacterium]
MYFAVMKITFMVDEDEAGKGGTSHSAPVKQELQSLVEKLRARFRIAVLPGQIEEPGEAPVIAIASLAYSEESLSRQLDSICEFCESSGFGRIDTERTLLDHIDSFGSDEDEYGDDAREDDDDDDDDDDGSPFDRSH